jgi:tetratricopeptide (TPR) repeat protein
VLFLFSLLSKAVAVVLPLVLLLIDYYQSQKISRKDLLEKIPFLALSLYFGIKAYNIQATGAIARPEAISLFQQIIFGSYGALMYVLKFFVPFKLSAFYPYPNLTQSGNIPLEYFSGLLIWPLTLLLLYYGYKKNRHILFGTLFFFITIVLVLQFISVGSALMADRYSYLPYVGIAFMLGMIVYEYVQQRAALKNIFLAATAIYLVAMCIITYQRTQIWKDNITLWSDVINKYPTVEVAYKNRGNYYGKELGKIDESYRDYMVLKKMNSKDTKVYSNMGNVYGLRNQPDSAIWAYNKAIALDANNEEAFINRGITYSMLKQYDKAIDDFIAAEKIKGSTASLLQNRAYTYLAAGKYAESAKDYSLLLQLRPNDGQSYFYSALANEGLGNYTTAKQHIQQAIALGYKVDEATKQRITAR